MVYFRKDRQAIFENVTPVVWYFKEIQSSFSCFSSVFAQSNYIVCFHIEANILYEHFISTNLLAAEQ